MLGVCGGIAAYKAVALCRRLVDLGAWVVPVLTEDALRFVGKASFSALASEPAQVGLFDGPDPIPHTRLGQRAELVVVAPATAHLLGRYAGGLADDLLTATLLATRAPVLVAPAMHAEMWEHPAVQDNLATLRRRGVAVVEPGTGRLAGGDEGPGRMAEPEVIATAAAQMLSSRTGTGISHDAARRAPSGTGGPRGRRLEGVTVLVSAGGTREPFDPVRYLGNRSSGKQGHALADEAAARGARVVLVTTADLPVAEGVEVVRVETAAEMQAALAMHAPEAAVVVMAAAVADFRPKLVHPEKLKRSEGLPELVLEPTPDILAGLVARRRPGQVLVGFAAETGDVRAKAREKLLAKGVDLIVANDVTEPGAGFEHDTNAVVILGADGSETVVARAPKREVAAAVLDAAEALLATWRR